ncbi:disease resistance protein-like [Arabidopsis thaliana]|uniref:ADP-ribosyl cyclase/cyclic ADP-ribose hydrolase n=1 Tax=Arabidopsis thaliana TaxID=3702 RepID=Q9LUK0_ARATH|nr:disease resistance protein-like [Arabidopsis thaliana]
MATSSSSCNWVYDVFPSFSGEDVRKTFLSHLQLVLDRKLITSFKDNEIERSQSIAPELVQGIKDSRIAIVIFSKNYASSSWCLNELLEIVSCKEDKGQLVIPVFYALDPTHVRKQTGDFGMAFERTCLNKTEDEKNLWRVALTHVANILGYHSAQCRANPDDYNMKLHLQETFLSTILGKQNIKIDHLGALGERLKHQKVLLFIDDLDQQVVLNALAGQIQWFGSGSRIIVVTNDKHLLISHGIENIYQVCLPSKELALEMLCRYAFRQNTPPDGFKKLAVEVVRHAGILPLGLNVLGSYLRGRNKRYWMDMLPRLRKGLDGKIQKALRVGYDGLDNKKDEAIFRHIACLFNFEKVNDIRLLLADSDLNFNIGLENLVDKSLVNVRSNIVEMHCLLQEMGREIVRAQSNEAGEREFLMDTEDICDVLDDNIGTKKMLGISLDVDEIDHELNVHEKAFQGMRNLRFLNIYTKALMSGQKIRLHLPENFDYLPPKLKLLCWDKYPMRCLPSSFRPENLVKLKMQESELEKLWEGVGSLTCLKDMDLEKSKNLKEIPDLSMATNLKTLNLKYCSSLVKISSSIQNLNKLTKLNMEGCTNLETLPAGINLKSLHRLDLRGCSRLRMFPDISNNISVLFLDKTSIEEFPSNLHLKKLFDLSMQQMNSEKLWEGVQPLTCLMKMLSPPLAKNFNTLYLSDIPSLVELPCGIQNLKKLMELSIRRCKNLESLPTGANFKYLDYLDLSGCSKLRSFPDISSTISCLCLNRTGIEEVPSWIENFVRLTYLTMLECNKLKYVSLNIFKLKHLDKADFSDCGTLTEVSWCNKTISVAAATADNIQPKLLVSEASSSLCVQKSVVRFINCFKLDQEALLQQEPVFKSLILGGEEVPAYFNHRATGNSLVIPLVPTSISLDFLGFRACALVDVKAMSMPGRVDIQVSCRFRGSLKNHFDSADHSHSLVAFHKASHLLIFDCRFALNNDSNPLNYAHMDITFHLTTDSVSKINACGIRFSEGVSPQKHLNGPSSIVHVCEADESKLDNDRRHAHETEHGEECGDSNVETVVSRKRIKNKKKKKKNKGLKNPNKKRKTSLKKNKGLKNPKRKTSLNNVLKYPLADHYSPDQISQLIQSLEPHVSKVRERFVLLSRRNRSRQNRIIRV